MLPLRVETTGLASSYVGRHDSRSAIRPDNPPGFHCRIWHSRSAFEDCLSDCVRTRRPAGEFHTGLPAISLNPDFIFLTVLPPLLFASAGQTSWAEFKYNLVSITSLAFGLVGFTVLGVSFAAHWLIPGFDWRLGLVLGAAVAPTDAIAATAIAQRLGLPKRIVDLLEGESLVNDASGLVALQFSTALVVSGSVPSLTGGILRLLSLVAGGILIGVMVGRVFQFVDSHVDNARIEIALSIVTPYAAYSAAEAAHASGVLATVAAGLYLGRQTSVLFSSRVRIESQSFWGT